MLAESGNYRMEAKAPNQEQLSHRTSFWVVFLTLVLVCLGFLLPAYFRRWNAGRTCEVLEPILSADARFKAVAVSRSTHGVAILGGSVASDADAAALRLLVEQAHPPQKPVFVVRVLASTNDTR